MAHLKDSTDSTPEFGPNERQNRYGFPPRFTSPHDEPEENEGLNSGGAYCDSHDEAADDEFSSGFWRTKH